MALELSGLEVLLTTRRTVDIMYKKFERVLRSCRASFINVKLKKLFSEGHKTIFIYKNCFQTHVRYAIDNVQNALKCTAAHSVLWL